MLDIRTVLGYIVSEECHKGEPLTSVIERIIQEAIAEGHFNDLPGEGKPLSLEEYPHEDPASAAAHHLLKEQGFALPWIALGKEIDAALVSAIRRLTQRHAWIAKRGVALAESGHWRRVEQEFRDQIASINQQIEHFNLSAPLARFHRRPVDADIIVSRIEGARIGQAD
jgi:DnaJ family protein C protein 28